MFTTGKEILVHLDFNCFEVMWNWWTLSEIIKKQFEQQFNTLKRVLRRAVRIITTTRNVF